MRRYALSDDQFARIEHLLPGRPGHVGRNSDKGNRLFVEAVIWKFRTGASRSLIVCPRCGSKVLEKNLLKHLAKKCPKSKR